ncbi:MAG: hypothetical protein JW774_05725 [Candidatus Aureabacteria bacterium]|nr:hypothetical protein [Candidatus Auribacterota bacterium]
MSKYWVYCIFFVLFSCLRICGAASREPFKNSVVFIKTDSLIPDYRRPWQNYSSETQTGQGIAVGPYEILTLASLIQYHTLIQVQTSFQSTFIEAKAAQIDWDLNLAILSIDPAALDQPLKPVSFTKDIQTGEKLFFVRLTEGRQLLPVEGKIESPEVYYNPLSGASFLFFRLSSSSSQIETGQMVCAENNRVLGLVYPSKNQINFLIPALILDSFLKRMKEKPAQSIPKAGFTFSAWDQPDSRRFLKIPDQEKRGVYLSEVFDFGTGSTELKEGDVLLNWDGKDIDPQGMVEDDKWGKLSFTYLFSRSKTQDKVKVTLWRDGQKQTIDVVMLSFHTQDLPIPYHPEGEPAYILEGGFLFQELNLNYLRTIGQDKEWKTNLDPLIFDFLVKNSFHVFKDRERMVLLTRVLPHPLNQGYFHLKDKILSSINGKKIRNFKDAFDMLSSGTKDQAPYLSVDFEDPSVPTVVIPVNPLKQANLEIQKNYSIFTLSKIPDEHRGYD